ncbi:MAG: lysophospholipid acyltransferase family protein [Acholeplasmataceae bacterium]|jgi:hypothetical protein|nr:lysophospholipid acyltransferase family protein [Acholeplasmataceae bacterium]
MKKRRIDKQQDILLSLLRPFVYLWMRKDAKRKVFLDDQFSFKRKGPFVMLANHTFMFDVVHVPLRIRHVPFIVANQTLFKKKATKFLVSRVAHVISKHKGQTDTQTVRELIGAVKRGYPILIFPEGDTTFFGETGYIEESTMKLIKKLEIDVVTCNVKGGYLSKPRWASGKRKNRSIELHYELTLTKEQIAHMTVEEISDVLTEKLYHNAYAYQRTKMVPHPGKKLAEGFENVCYVCPVCESLHTLETHGNEIMCRSCETKGFMDAYGFIQGFPFDNIIDWNQFQRNYKEELKKSTFKSTAKLYFINEENLSMEEVGNVILIYENNHFTIHGDLEEKIDLGHISHPTLSLRRDFGFTYNEKNYHFVLDHHMLAFLRIAQDKY